MPELRKDPLTGCWVAVATERILRVEDFHLPQPPATTTTCRLCPGREHELPPALLTVPASNDHPGDAWAMRVLPSKFPMLRIEGDLQRRSRGVYDVMLGVGAHEVLVETPEHGVDLAERPVAAIARMLGLWVERIVDLQRDTRLRAITITRTRGYVGQSAHAHAELVATPVVPHPLHTELLQARAYHDYRDRCLLCDMIAQERDEAVRLVQEEGDAIAFTPFASASPFEVWIAPLRHAARLPAISESERHAVASLLQSVVARFDRVLRGPSYDIALCQAPSGEDGSPAYHWHLKLRPRLAAVGSVAPAGGMRSNPLAPEDAARLLRQG